MRRNPLLVVATMLAVLVSSFLVFTTLSGRAVVENNTARWQNGVHVVIFLDDRVTTTAHKQLQESLETYPEVRMVDYFTKAEAADEFKLLFEYIYPVDRLLAMNATYCIHSSNINFEYI